MSTHGTTRRPNMVRVTVDRQRAGTMICDNHRGICTPHLDQLTDEGVRFGSLRNDRMPKSDSR